MSSEWAIAGLGSAFVAGGAVLAVSLLRGRRDLGQTGAAQLVGDLVRLLVRLLRDDTMPWHVRARIGGAILYNAQPINVIPDFIPVVGFADNLVVTYWALRSTVRAAGPEALRRNWPGSEEGLALVFRLAGISGQELGAREWLTSAGRQDRGAPD